ncbi:MAG: hypothetical protein JXB18_00015 [Sedimentisphaerales bacterium]|nr:hypothetical protein [Sedimentisphaerales bacterium]
MSISRMALLLFASVVSGFSYAVDVQTDEMAESKQFMAVRFDEKADYLVTESYDYTLSRSRKIKGSDLAHR